MTLKIRSNARPSLVFALCSVALAACGGGSAPAVAPVVPVVSTQSVAVTVIDGAIKGATVCLDKNGNGVCDLGEPQGISDASGKVTLTVEKADAGKFPVIAVVGAGAIDADTGAVATPYVMKAPSDQVGVVSPLTTMVQAQIDASGASTADAAAFVQAQTGLSATASLFADYTADKSAPDASLAAALARLIVLTTQQQALALAGALGQPDISGAPIVKTDIDKAINQALLGVLPALVAAAGDSTVSGAASGTEREKAIAALATAIVQNQTGLDTAALEVLAGAAKMPPDASGPASAPAATAALRALSFTDAGNWSYRAMEGTVADNTPDSKGMIHYYDVRMQDVAGTLTTWGFNNKSARQGDLHWNGSAWAGCALGFRSEQTARDVKGLSAYNYCDGWELGVSQRTSVDIGGRSQLVGVALIRKFLGADSGLNYADWGPSNLLALGTASFPSGSMLHYQTNQVLATAATYDVTSKVGVYAAPVAAGGIATAAPACATASVASPAATLETVIARASGTPCVFGKTTETGGATSLDSNAWWDNSTISLGLLADATVAPTAYYTNNVSLRASFAASGKVVTFYSCLERKSSSSARNCTAIGSGNYSIATLGDARVLSLSNPPLLAQQLGYKRLLVERAGIVYYGYQDQSGASKSTLRLNLAAANALLTQLGIPAIAPTP